MNWTEKFNSQSEEVRTIGQAMELQTRIQHLNFEKDRLKSRYNQSVKEINDHIKNCEQSLERLSRERLNEITK